MQPSHARWLQGLGTQPAPLVGVPRPLELASACARDEAAAATHHQVGYFKQLDLKGEGKLSRAAAAPLFGKASLSEAQLAQARRLARRPT